MWQVVVPTTAVLQVDFNETDERRNVLALRTRENRRVALSIGDHVQLRDEDGFQCIGIVRRVTGKAYRVAPQWATWRNPKPVRITSKPEPVGDMLTVLFDALSTVSSKEMVEVD